MEPLEVSGAVRLLYVSLDVKGLNIRRRMEWNGLMQQRVPWIKPEVMWPLVILYSALDNLLQTLLDI